MKMGEFEDLELTRRLGSKSIGVEGDEYLKLKDRLFVLEDKLERIYMELMKTVDGTQWGTIEQMEAGLLAIHTIVIVEDKIIVGDNN
jgi:hypothetical protein